MVAFWIEERPLTFAQNGVLIEGILGSKSSFWIKKAIFDRKGILGPKGILRSENYNTLSKKAFFDEVRFK